MKQIKHKDTSAILFELEAVTMKEAVVAAVSVGAYLGGADLEGAYLGGAYLRGAYLRGAYLGGADLEGADLGGADLGGAYLRGADLRGAYLGVAYLGGAYLRGADLRGAVIAWQSHDLIAHLLFTKAGSNTNRRSLAGLILISKDWCWDQFMKLEHPEREWAIGVLKALRPEGMPDQLRVATVIPAPA
jgi:uncharacterized protein YjbI with pentapeptide repeats